MKSIFLLTNFSEAASKAIRSFISVYGPRLAGNCKLKLVNAWNQPRTGHFQMINLDEYLEEISVADLQHELSVLTREYQWPEKDLEIVSKKGDIVDVVNQLTETGKPDLIVAGTKGSNLMREILIGSTTGRILRQVKLPTLLIPENIEFTNPERIVFATDLQECKNQEDFEKLTNLVRLFMSEFLILHIYKVEKPDVGYFEKCMEQYLEGINYSFYYEQHVNIESGILDFVANLKCGLLSMIGRKDELLIQLLKHSVTQGIVQRAAIPMLIIHE